MAGADLSTPLGQGAVIGDVGLERLRHAERAFVRRHREMQRGHRRRCELVEYDLLDAVALGLAQRGLGQVREQRREEISDLDDRGFGPSMGKLVRVDVDATQVGVTSGVGRVCDPGGDQKTSRRRKYPRVCTGGNGHGTTRRPRKLMVFVRVLGEPGTVGERKPGADDRRTGGGDGVRKLSD